MYEYAQIYFLFKMFIIKIYNFVKNKNAMVIVSDSAKNELISLMQRDGGEKKYVRVGVTSGGCSGLSYSLDFDSEVLSSDKLFEHNEIKLVVDEKSYLYLVGTTLSYSGGLNGKGFVFENPNASRTCGCGESFAV